MNEDKTRTRELIFLRAEQGAHQVDALVGYSVEVNGVVRDVIFAAPLAGARLVRRSLPEPVTLSGIDPIGPTIGAC